MGVEKTEKPESQGRWVYRDDGTGKRVPRYFWKKGVLEKILAKPARPKKWVQPTHCFKCNTLCQTEPFLAEDYHKAKFLDMKLKKRVTCPNCRDIWWEYIREGEYD